MLNPKLFGRGCVAALLLSLGASLTGCADTGVAPRSNFISPQMAARAAADADGHTVAWSEAETPAGPLLVVISFGYGCPGTGGGNGLQELATAIRKAHPDYKVITRGWNDDDNIQYTIAAHHGPVALVGHSFGGSRSLDFAGDAGRAIQWMVLLDPVPSHDWAFRHDGKYFEVPPSVGRAICFYRPAGLWPLSYPIANPHTLTDNRMRNLGHAEIPATVEVRRCVLELCDQQAKAAAEGASAKAGARTILHVAAVSE